MNKVIKICVLYFLAFGIMPKAISQPWVQAFLITGEDTLTMGRTFITDTLEIPEITSNREKMSMWGCTCGSFFPTWKIENDSLFLIKLRDENDMRKEGFDIDLKKTFKERYVDGRVFGKEINYQIEAERFRNQSEYSSNIDSFYDNHICFTIRNGKVIDKGEFNDKTVWVNNFDYLSEEGIAKNTDWKNLPDISSNRLVTVKVITNDKGELVDASIIKNNDSYELEGENAWKKEALRQIKLIPKWSIHYKCGQVIDKEREIEFRFKKTR
jgi:hypothetical protein